MHKSSRLEPLPISQTVASYPVGPSSQSGCPEPQWNSEKSQPKEMLAAGQGCFYYCRWYSSHRLTDCFSAVKVAVSCLRLGPATPSGNKMPSRPRRQAHPHGADIDHHKTREDPIIPGLPQDGEIEQPAQSWDVFTWLGAHLQSRHSWWGWSTMALLCQYPKYHQDLHENQGKGENTRSALIKWFMSKKWFKISCKSTDSKTSWQRKLSILLP